MASRRARSTVEVRFPDLGLELDINERRLLGAAARAMAKQHKKALRRGVTSTGRPLRRGEDGGRALRDSGQLLKSIRGWSAKARGGRWLAVVGATGTRSDLGGSLRGRNAGLLGVLISGRRTEAQRPREPDLMASSPALDRVGADAFMAALERDLDRGRASLSGSRASLAGLAGRALRGAS